MQVLRKHNPGLPIHADIRTLDLCKHVAAPDLDSVIITTPCTDVSARGLGQAQDGVVRPQQTTHASRVWQLYGCCMQASPLFFDALEKVTQYGRVRGRLPTLFTENVSGIVFRRRALEQVCAH